jgi:hypothetical protein
VGFHEISILISWHLEDRGQFLCVPGSHASTQGEQVGRDSEIPLKHVISENNTEAILSGFHLRGGILVKPEEQDPFLPRFSVVVLQFSIGPNVTIKDVDIGLWIEFFDVQGILNGALAAYPRTVWMFFVS